MKGLVWRLQGEGGTQIGLHRGVPLKPQNPYPPLRVILQKRVPIVMDFSWKIDLFFTNFAIFRVFAMRKPQNQVGLSQKMGPMFKDFLQKAGPMLKDFL